MWKKLNPTEKQSILLKKFEKYKNEQTSNGEWKKEKLKVKYHNEIIFFSSILWALRSISREPVIYRKKKNKDEQSKTPIQKKYNPKIMLSLLLSKILIPYWSNIESSIHHIPKVNKEQLYFIRWYIAESDNTLGEIPPEYYHIISKKNEWNIWSNFSRIIKTISMDHIIEAISGICAVIDSWKGSKVWRKAFIIAIKWFTDQLPITDEERKTKKTWVLFKKAGRKTWFDYIFHGNRGKELYQKTRQWFIENFYETICSRIEKDIK